MGLLADYMSPLRAGRWARWGAAVLSAAALTISVVPAASATEVMLPNLRAQREPARPWTVQAWGLTASVAAATGKGTPGWARWTLSVRLTGARVRAITTPTADAEIAGLAVDADGVTRLEVRVSAPRVCRSSSLREPVLLRLEKEDGQGAWIAADIEIDHRCLLGDVIVAKKAAPYATAAARSLQDPLIDALVTRAALPKGDPSAEADFLKKQLGFDAGSVRTDPSDAVEHWSPGSAYVLSPTETARLGGDCEDWTILVSAFLARRGYAVSVAEAFGHVWVRARAADGRTVDLDFIDTPPDEEPLSVSPVAVPLPAASGPPPERGQ